MTVCWSVSPLEFSEQLKVFGYILVYGGGLVF